MSVLPVHLVSCCCRCCGGAGAAATTETPETTFRYNGPGSDALHATLEAYPYEVTEQQGGLQAGAPPTPPGGMWAVEFNCGPVRDCVPDFRLYATRVEADAAARAWDLAGGGRFTNVRPARAGEQIVY